MTRPRSQLIAPESTPYYHCIARCVRRAFLCGTDTYSGRNFDHRKGWLLQRIKQLEAVFAINVAAYALMSNHYHLVLHIDTEYVRHWSMEEVIRRWRRLYKGPILMQRYQAGEHLTDAELATVRDIAEVWRQRLTSISWFMANLNEFIARQANKEDNCKGRFWEGRFKSQALLDETAVLSCMAYVDLNPVRAGLANSLETSAYTSIQQRLQRAKQLEGKGQSKPLKHRPRLMPFAEAIKAKAHTANIPFTLKDYIALVDWTGRAVRHDKRGHIPPSIPKTLHALGLSPPQWQALALSVQKQSILMLHGLDWVATTEAKQAKRKTA